MKNVRRHFRLDVDMPVVIRLADQQDEVVRIVIPELSGGQWQRSEKELDQQMSATIQRLAMDNATAEKVLVDMVARLQLLCEGILVMVQGGSPEREVPHYLTRRRVPALVTQLKGQGSTVVMLQALNEKFEFHLAAIDAAAKGKYEAFLDMMKSVKFRFDALIAGLQAKASEGAVLARAVLALHEKLLRHLPFLEQYRQQVRFVVDENSWPKRQINISAGGYGFVAKQSYPKFARLLILFQLGPAQEEFRLTGRIVNTRPLNSGDNFIAVEFDAITPAQQERLIQLVQNEELVQAIAYLQSQKAQADASGEAW